MAATNLLELRQVAYFVRVAELGSFTRAAAALDIAQSALSRHVSQLERHLGARLLHRTGRGVVLTDEGLRALGNMKALLADAERLDAELTASSDNLVGTVSLGILSSLTPVLLTPLLRAVHDRFPGVKMCVREGLTNHLEEWLAAGTIDLAILYGSRPVHAATDQVLLSADLYLMGAPGERITQRKSVRLAELAHLPMLLPAVPNRHRLLIDKVFAERNIALNVTFELDSIQTMKDLAASGRNFTILPLHAAHREVSGGYLQAARIVDPSITRNVLLTHTTHHPRNRLCRAVERLAFESVESLTQSGQLPGRR
jgi:LysR family nitrogen assimilation transcriptional regulator